MSIMESLKSDSKDNCGGMPRKKKKQISLTIDVTLLEWVDKEVEDFNFGSRSSAFELALNKLKKETEAKKR